MDWEKTKSRIESRECCKHIGGRMFVDKVGLSCCRGTATSCKGAEFLFLVNMLHSKSDEIDKLEAQINKMRAQIDKLQGKETITYNNCTINENCTINQTVNVINIMDTLKLSGLSLIQKAKQCGSDVYKIAYAQMQHLPPSEDRNQLMKLFKSNDPRDHVDYKQNIVNLISESVDEDKTISKIELENINKSIDVENSLILKQAEDLNMEI